VLTATRPGDAATYVGVEGDAPATAVSTVVVERRGVLQTYGDVANRNSISRPTFSVTIRPASASVITLGDDGERAR
jgi:hypothetical protein